MEPRTEKPGDTKEELIADVVEKADAVTQKEKEARNEAYNAYVRQVTGSYSLVLNVLKAFLTGGLICFTGQIITNVCVHVQGMDADTAGKWTSLILILASAVLTGLNIYPSLAQFGGAGVLVPITGFANGIASSAMEFKKEGQVFGLGAQIFGIGGPVILYGIFTSWVLGVIYLVIRILA